MPIIGFPYTITRRRDLPDESHGQNSVNILIFSEARLTDDQYGKDLSPPDHN
jgi:hypothetical protein